MQNPIQIASNILLTPAGLAPEDLFRVLKSMMLPKIDGADIFLQYLQGETWHLEEGMVKSGIFSIDQGFGLRAFSGEHTGFAYADDVNMDALKKAARMARSIVSQGRSGRVQVASRSSFNLGLYPFINPIKLWSEEKKIALLRKVEKAAYRQDKRVIKVIVNLDASYEVVLLWSSDTGLSADIRPMVDLNVMAIVADGNKKERGSAGAGARRDYNFLIENDLAIGYAKEAVRVALLNLEAKPAPAGRMPVVLGAGWPAVLLHEAVGHGLESDFIRKKTSVYCGKVGERVAAKGCTIIDQGNLPGFRRGSSHIDDEGTPTQCTLLIDDGVLCGYMHDKLNARLLGVSPTGNGRRESYAFPPVPRMTNTYMLNGNHDVADIISSVSDGLYAVNFSGGQVDITSGEFVFTTSEAYIIKNGKITSPVKRATLIGNGPKILHNIDMVGNDTKLDEGIGTCGKDGQSVPVGVGQPTLRIKELTVGGTAA